MAVDNSINPRNWKEGRRLRAWELKREGWKQRDIAKALGVTEGAVSQWLKRAREDGVEGLLTRKGSGPPSKLTEHQRRAIPKLLQKNPKTYGFPSNTWTCRLVALVIERQYGVSYHPSHVSRLLRDVGYALSQQ